MAFDPRLIDDIARRLAGAVPENVAALRIRLTPAQLAALDAEFPPDAAAGDRYPANMMAALNR